MFEGKRLLPVILLTTLIIFGFNQNILLGDEFISISTQHHTENDFLRVPEFFTGKEFTGTKVILRSTNHREGLYFYIPWGNSHLQKANSIELNLIDSTSPHPRAFNFSLPKNLNKKKSLLIGVTGKDWNEKIMNLIAWKVVISDSKEKKLLVSQSSLWAHKK